MPKGKQATRDRRPGRRALASPEVITKHDKIIKAEIRKEEDLKAQLDAQKTVIAERCFDAMEDGVETNHIGENLLKLSRQMVYKLVRERVFGKTPSGETFKSPGKPAKTKTGKAKTAEAKSAPAKKSNSKKAGKGVAAFAKRTKKDDKKEPAKKRSHRRPVQRKKAKASK